MHTEQYKSYGIHHIAGNFEELIFKNFESSQTFSEIFFRNQ